MRIYTLTNSKDFASSHPETYVEVYLTKESLVEALKRDFNVDMPDLGDEVYFEWQKERQGSSWTPAVLFNEYGQKIENGFFIIVEQLFYEEHEV